MVLIGLKTDQGACSLQMFANFHLCFVLLGPPGLFAHLLGDLRTSSDQYCSHSLIPTMPRDRGKPRHSTRNKNAYTRDNRLTASQRALIAHFSQPRRPSSKAQSALRIPKEENLPTSTQTQALLPLRIPKTETPSPTELSPQPSQLASALPNKVKEEAPPSPQHSGTKVEEVELPSQPGPSLVHLHKSPETLSPSTSRDFQPRWWEGGCIVEEEIPPSWQLSKDGEDTGEAGADGGNDGADKGRTVLTKAMTVLKTQARSMLKKAMTVLSMAHTTSFISQRSTWSFSLTSDSGRTSRSTAKRTIHHV
jgi:hypothetical protein